ncbi:MAG: MMPL family transporter [bacterium]|nr:MMPL family transporter [bacterium]
MPKTESFISRFETAFGPWVIKWRWVIIIVCILITLSAASGVRLLTTNNDTRVFFSKENPQLQALDALENTYNRINNVLFTIAPKDGNVFTRETLGMVEELTEASWLIPYSSRVDSLSNFQYTWAEEDDLIVEDLYYDAENLADEDFERIKQIAFAEPALVDNLLSPSGHVTGVNVLVMLPGESQEEVPGVAAFVRKMANELRQKYPEIEIHLTGMVMSDNAFGEASEKDISTLMPLMFLVLIIFVGLSLRSIFGTFGTFLIVLMSMSSGMGLAGWFGIEITVASMNAPVLILTLAVADSVHILAIIFHQMHEGNTKREAIAESLRVNLQAVFLTSATTAIGFLTMNFSDAPPFRDLGNIVAMGVMTAFFYAVFFLPALIAVLPIRTKPKKVAGSDCCSCQSLANFVINRRNLVFWGTLVVIVTVTLGTLRIDLNENFLKYFDDTFAYRRAVDFQLENLTGYDVIEYSLESGEEGGINEPEYLAALEEFANWYRTQPKVVHVSTLSDTMKRLNKNMHGDDEAYYRLPEQRELAAQYLLLYEMSLPFGLDLNNQINVDKSATRMTVAFQEMSTTEQREMDEKAVAWLKENAPESMHTSGTGLTIVWAHITGRNIKSMLNASFWAIMLISAILIFALRSFRLGLMSLIPNLAPALMAFGVWGIIKGQVGLGLSIVISMTIGIVVDDTIHFLSKYLRARREHDLDRSGAVRYAFNAVGTAMWVTTLALVAGFLVLTFSHYRMSSDMGLMSAITIALALGMDFFLLPTLLMKVDKKTY